MKKNAIAAIVLGIVIIGALVFSLKDDRKGKQAETNAVSPPAPTMVTASSGVRQVHLTWGPVREATSYRIYWSTQSGGSRTGDRSFSVADTFYDHTGLTENTTYYYVVTAVNAKGESPPSMEVSAVAWPPYPVSESRVQPESKTSSAPPMSESEFERELMNRLMNSELPAGEPPDEGEPTWDPNKETPPPRDQWPDAGEPTWDPNKETPPPRDQWPGVGETPKQFPEEIPPQRANPM